MSKNDDSFPVLRVIGFKTAMIVTVAASLVSSVVAVTLMLFVLKAVRA